MMNKKIIIILMSLIIIILVTAITANFLEQQQTQQQWQQQFQNLNRQIQQQNIALITTQNKLTQFTHLMKQNTNQQGLSEVSFLIDLANVYLQLNHDVKNAIKLLNLAEYHLRSLADPRFLPLEQALASNLNRLKEVEVIDPANLILQLQTLAESTSRLSFTPNHFAKTPSPAGKLPPPSWFEKFKGFVSISYKKTDNLPLLPPDQREFIRENIEFSLKQAQWAVLQQQEALYQQSLSQVQQWITAAFIDNEARAHILERLRNLSEVNINPPIPELKETLQALQQALVDQSALKTLPPPPAIPESKSTPNHPPPNPPATPEYQGIEI